LVSAFIQGGSTRSKGYDQSGTEKKGVGVDKSVRRGPRQKGLRDSSSRNLKIQKKSPLLSTGQRRSGPRYRQVREGGRGKGLKILADGIGSKKLGRSSKYI